MDTPPQMISVLDTYSVFIGNRLLEKIDSLINIRKYSKIFVISDHNVAGHWLKSLKTSMQIEPILVKSGELEKNIKSVSLIWKQLLEKKADRRSLVLNLGGGVIGDMGGFAAATYMRGIPFIQIPTTLLSQVDASVGGKLAIDFGGVKNSVGSFVQPGAVIIDIQTLKTLSPRIFTEGFGEIIKHGIIADSNYFNKVTAKNPSEFTDAELIEIISGSVQIKADIVSKDEKESGDRKKLNFGHTIGHAMESLSLEGSEPLLHGEAVSLGMVAEAKLSELKGLIGRKEYNLIRSALKNAGLPVTAVISNPDQVIDKMSSDKKSISGNIKWTLVSDIGHAVIDQSVERKDVIKALALLRE